MKELIKLIILLLILSNFSCNKSEEETLIGNWVELSDFEGLPRSYAASFVIGTNAYMGTGYDGDDRFNDFWKYSPETDSWTQIADFPGVARNSAVGFGIGYHYGYIGTGYDGNTLKDFYEYDPSTDTWTKKTSVGGSKRRGAIAFVIDNYAYVGTGFDNGAYEDDFWEYNAETETWTQLNDIANSTSLSFDDAYTVNRNNAVAFSINGKGYVATGGQGAPGTEVWEYDPITDLWEEKTSFEGYERLGAIGFALDNRGYVVAGRSSSYYFDDVWAFDPDAEYNEYD
jgi:N-acetylneuraminic acid mutarotase